MNWTYSEISLSLLSTSNWRNSNSSFSFSIVSSMSFIFCNNDSCSLTERKKEKLASFLFLAIFFLEFLKIFYIWKKVPGIFFLKSSLEQMFQFKKIITSSNRRLKKGKCSYSPKPLFLPRRSCFSLS